MHRCLRRNGKKFFPVPEKPKHTVLTEKHGKDMVILKFAEGSNIRLRQFKRVNLGFPFRNSSGQFLFTWKYQSFQAIREIAEDQAIRMQTERPVYDIIFFGTAGDSLKITDKGLVDVNKFDFVPLFAE